MGFLVNVEEHNARYFILPLATVLALNRRMPSVTVHLCMDYTQRKRVSSRRTKAFDLTRVWWFTYLRFSNADAIKCNANVIVSNKMMQ